MFPTGTNIPNSLLTIVSLSIVFSTDLSGGYKDSDDLKLLSGKSYYEEMLRQFKFRVSPFAFFQVNTSVFEKMLSVIEEFT